MFVLSKVQANVSVLPADMGLSTVEGITRVIEKNYFDKVVHDVGLVVSLYEIESLEGGYVYQQDGTARFNVLFSLVVFRPGAGEVLTGRIAKCDRQGLVVSLGGFFDDVRVPEHLMQEGSMFVAEEGAWVWKYDGQDLFYDVGETVRVRVGRVTFHEAPPPPELQVDVKEEDRVGTAARPHVPMEIEAAVNEEGLGLTSWWEGQEEDEEEEGSGGGGA